MATNAKWFQDQAAKHNLTQRAIARSLDLDPPTLSLMIHGKRKLTIASAIALASLFKVPVEDVFAAAGIKTPIESRESMDLAGWVDGSAKIRWGAPKGPSTAPRPAFASKNMGVLRYQTLGSALEGMDGVLVYYLENAVEGVSNDLVGKMCVVQIGESKKYLEEEWRIGTIKRGYSAGAFNLVAMSGNVIAEGVLIGKAWPIVWIKM